MAEAVLDTSALLAYVGREPGREAVDAVIGSACISAANWAEAVSKLVERGGSLETVRAALGIAPVEVIDFDQPLAEAAGALIANTRRKGLSLGDCACLALAARENLPAITADRAWADLDLGIDIRLIR
jgi:PIN domain nuclease of toxin-antitoxin system